MKIKTSPAAPRSRSKKAASRGCLTFQKVMPMGQKKRLSNGNQLQNIL